MNTAEAAAHWDTLADRIAAWRDYEAARGGYTAVLDRKIKLYRGTAESMRLGEATGVGHCACHVLPYKQCPRAPENMVRNRR